MRFRTVSSKRAIMAIWLVIMMLLPSFAFLPWGIIGEGSETTSRANSRANNDLAVLNILNPDDLDENVGAMVPDNAIPMGVQSVQAQIKNVGSLDQSGPIPVDFTFETGTETTLWSDNMDGGANGWVAKDLTPNNHHWHYTNGNTHGGGNYSLVSSFTSGPRSGYYGNWWEEVAEMANCVNIPASPSNEPYFRIWNFTNTQSNVDGGRVQMQIGTGQWNDIEPSNPFPPPALSYRGTINSVTSILSNGKGVFTGSTGWAQSEAFPLWQQNVGQINGTCVKFRLWFTSDSSSPSDFTGWFVDDAQVYDGNSVVWTDTMANPGSGNWTFKNLMEIGASNGFEQFNGSGTDGSVAWWVGNMSKKSYINGTDHVLESPSISLTGGGINEARFTYMQKYNITPKDGGWVEISNDGGSSWNYVEPHFDQSTPASITTKYPGYIDSASDFGAIGAFEGNMTWHKMTFDLTQYIGSNIKIRFHFYSNWDNKNDKGWFIDDLVVKGWNFANAQTDSANINAVNSGSKVTAQVNFDFDTETDYRITALVGLVGDQDTSNDEWRAVVRVKNIRDFSITTTPMPTGFTRTTNHGGTLKFWINVTNTGNLPDDFNISLTGQPAGWNVSFTPPNLTGVQPGSAPAMLVISVKTTIDSGPSTYPDDTKQTQDFPLVLNITSVIDGTNAKERTLTGKVTNTRPTVDFPIENLNGRVYKEFRPSQPNYEDKDGDSLSFIWDWGDGSPVETTDTWDTPHIYNTSKSASNPYVLSLKVFDDLVESDTSTVNVTVSNNPPSAKFVIDTIAINNTFAKGDKIVFNASSPTYSNDENPDGLTFRWSFGDGNTGDGAVVNHTYTTGGDKVLNLTVLDEEDAVSYAEKTISINTPPTAVITTPVNLEEFFLGDDIVFNATESSDNEQAQSELDFIWTSNRAGELGNQMLFTKSFKTDDDIGNHQITLTVIDRKAKGIAYDVKNIVIKARPQNPPVLEKEQGTPAVDPSGGFVSTNVFKFSVLYKDPDADRPRFVRVVIDGGSATERSYDMIQTDPTNKDYKTGVLFQVTVPGNGIGADKLHKFYFEAADERNETVIVKSSTFDGPRITREKLIQNQAITEIHAGVVFAKVRYVGLQDEDPIKLTVSATSTAPPSGLLGIGLYVELSAITSADLWDSADLSFKYGSDDFTESRDQINLSSIKLYKLTGGIWSEVPEAENDDNGLIVSLVGVTEEGSYGLFGKEKVTIEGPHDHNPTAGFLEQYLGLIIVLVVVIVVVVVIAVMFRKKKPQDAQWGGDEAIDLKIDIISGTGTDEEAVAATTEEGVVTQQEDIDTSAGGEVAVYTPGGGTPEASTEESEVAVYRPGGGAVVVSEEGEIEESGPVWAPGGGTGGEETSLEEAPTEEPKTWTPPEQEETIEAPSEEVAEEPTEALTQGPTSEQEPGSEVPKAPEEGSADEKKEKTGEDEQDLLDEILGED